MRLAGIEDFSDGDILVIRTEPNQGFGEAYEMLQDAKTIANVSGIDPAFIALPKGVVVEHHRDSMALWAAKNGLGIRCRMAGDVPEFVVGSREKGVLSSASSLTMALEQAYEEYRK